MSLLPLRSVEELSMRRTELPADAVSAAREIIETVRTGGEPALRRLTEQFGERAPGDPLLLDRPALRRALDALDHAERGRLERVAARIASFAASQRTTLSDVTVAIPGGKAGHTVVPVQRAGCYVPGGRYPLPSSALMTAIPARAAGVGEVWLATPRPHPVTLAAAALADVEGVLVAGGAHAIAALAFGVGPVPAVDVVVGPGNVYVTAAKQALAGKVGIDMIAGPSELVILADRTADPALVAADLLAQAEHDVLALPILVSIDGGLVAEVQAELARQLEDLPTADVARAALCNGGALVIADLAHACEIVDLLAPEHVELLVEDPAAVARRIHNAGALFIGAGAGEVLGDYGAGPNHTLPTSGAARFTGGLSVFNFLRVRTWMSIDDPPGAAVLAEDAEWFARVEGLEAHARAAALRIPLGAPSVGNHTPFRTVP